MQTKLPCCLSLKVCSRFPDRARIVLTLQMTSVEVVQVHQQAQSMLRRSALWYAPQTARRVMLLCNILITLCVC